ncbi:MAG TPA: 16S rRNA (cytosine(967)-C(5))-methyltransferase RsmB [Gammaproteobacteria bacterium]|jgi:16S rRNA (cytosine967-C5)-methyltransferase|nr:16S rRNA (cytosine(967)-C(5))-methyltransferase RsmB [Gammaproteobacteria bacterium]
MAKRLMVREGAVMVALRVLRDGQSLSRALPEIAPRVPENTRALLQELSYGLLRWHLPLQHLQQQLVPKKLRGKDLDIALAIQLGLYQLRSLSVPDHAVVQETVAVARQRGKPWARGLINAVLRRYLRERDALDASIDADDTAAFAHPAWLLQRFQADWPNDWQALCHAGNRRPPMTVRVNQHQTDRDAYLSQLHAAGIEAQAHPLAVHAIELTRPMAVEQLPGFDTGRISVQDAGAQLAAQILAPSAGERVLDACAAPGGKTGHLLEAAPESRVTALDNVPERCEKVHQNLSRLALAADVRCADAADTGAWWDGETYDAILLDAPCSALGVIRRHPDIKSLRTPSDLEALVHTQRRLLEALWPLLKPGGRLLYATCSVARCENDEQVLRFINSHDDASHSKIGLDCGNEESTGRQILSGQLNMDGFFYALLEKTAA